MLQIGVLDPALQRELGAIKNPTLPAFSDKLEGYTKPWLTWHLDFLLRAILNVLSPLLQLLKQISVLTLPVKEVKGTDASLCEADVFVAHATIICFPSVRIRLQSNATHAMLRVIFLWLPPPTQLAIGSPC